MDKNSNPMISVVLMVKNEQHNIKDFFHTVGPVTDELIIVDTGSTDGTLELCEEMAGQVSFPVHIFKYWKEKFHDGQTREYAASKANGDYILQVDADERLSDDFKKNLRQFLIEKKPAVVTIPRVDELVPHLRDVMDYRLFKKDEAHYLGGSRDAVHPHLAYTDPPAHFNYPIFHVQGINHWLRRPHRIFDQLSREIEEVPNTRGLFREFLRGILGAFYKFRKVYFRLETRRDGWPGLKYSFLKALYVFLFHLFIGLKPRLLTER